MNHLESSFAGRNAFWRYFIMVVALFAATNTIGAIPLLIAIGIKSAESPELISRLAENPSDLSAMGLDPNLYLMMMIFPFIIGLATFIALIGPLHGKKFFQVINGTGSFRWKRYFISALIWLLVSGLYLAISIRLDPGNIVLNNTSGTLIPLIIISIIMIPFQAAFEEILFRGYLMQGFTNILRNRWFPLLMTSLFFALMHAMNPEVKEFGFFTMMPQYLLFGLIFGIITILDDGIEAALGAHAANNIFLCIMVTSESSALQTPALYRQMEINPWADLISMLIMGTVVIITLKFLFGWKNLKELINKAGSDKISHHIL